MITVELTRNKSGNDELKVKTDETDSEGLAELDQVFEIMVGERPRRGGYLGSSAFVVEVKAEENKSENR